MEKSNASQSHLKMLVEGAMMIALAYVLSLVKVWEMPNGGSITAGSMLPIIIFAYRWGGSKGLFVGAVYGIIQFILGPKWSFHIISILGDYIVAFAALGLAGYIARMKDPLGKCLVGMFIGIFFRFAGHVISGVVVFGAYAPEGQSPLIYSIVYNASYLIPEFVLTAVIFAFIYGPLKRSGI
ncbi:energy-coupled thiamine transporter ThiT [Fusibacter paucivorans]|uniref:Energy-coupled thiamine transporter ThiT n=1 Tax=Fusibacter paucivorans TaxID=76009 RepID=A0ABS5PUQ6_9FIRM|nr:energy-coupled thiamine transporter ThiT [Fusibacter paucivorans]MBS7528301.1 energy-coupled thiamine transporter ThiT [Fusibacter paucivorans]